MFSFYTGCNSVLLFNGRNLYLAAAAVNVIAFFCIKNENLLRITHYSTQ